MRLLRISWDEADGIKQRRSNAAWRVRRSARPGLAWTKSAGPGQNYVTVVARLEPGAAGDGGVRGGRRTRRAWDAYWQRLPSELRAGGRGGGDGLGGAVLPVTVPMCR